MNAMNLPGIRFEAVEFPTAETARKYPGQMLKGVRFTLTDRASYRPLATSLVIIDLIRRLHPDQFQWAGATLERQDRKSTRLNSSHSQISYAVFCLKKKKKKKE